MKKILLSTALLCGLILSYAQPGRLDPSFGNKGFVATDMGAPANYTNFGNQVLLQPDGSIYLVFEGAGPTLITKKHADGSPDLSYGKNGISAPVPIYASHGALQTDGKIVVVGYTLNPDGYTNYSDFAVARFKTDGSLDSTFGVNGLVITDFMDADKANCITLQADGKIIVAGFTDEYYSATIYLVAARYNPDGSLDNTFDGDGKLTSAFGSFSDPTSVAVQSDGKILIAGHGYAPDALSANVFVIGRYNTDGSLDNSFDGDGIRSTDFGKNELQPSIAIQADGKIVLAGYFGDENIDNKFAVARYNTDGSTDNSFDGDGVLITNFGSYPAVASLALQSDGKIIVAGTAGTGTNHDFGIARYNSDGSPDNSFSGDGTQLTDFGSSNDFVNSIAVQADGKLVALGYTINGASTNLAVARYQADGSPDNSFDGDGLLTDRLTQGSTFYTCTAVQNDGKVLAAGYTWNGSNNDFALVRYNTDGSLDNTFSGDGKQMTDFASSDDRANAIIIQSDGKILVGGTAAGDFALARYNTDGSPDLSFDADGIQTTDFGSTDAILSLKIQTDGKILAAGSAIARYNTNGSLDVSFEGDGKLLTPFKSYDIALQSDGKIVAAGDDGGYAFIVRYNPDGTQDFNFGVEGRFLISSFFAGGDVGVSLAIQNDGKIVIGGHSEFAFRTHISSFMILRINPDGTNDGTFNGGAIVYTGINYLAFGTSLVLQNNGRIILAGYSYNGSSNDFTMVRYNTDGSLDATFGDNGRTVTSVSSAYDQIAGIAISGDKLYAAGYGQYPGNFGVIARYFVCQCHPLPVSLVNFTAVGQNKSVLLKWQTASEQNLSGFTVERSADGSSFSSIDYVTATGNSNLKINYSTIDKQPLPGINFYRLKIMDQDGGFTYSNIVSVNINNETFALKISPNPAKDVLYVNVSGENEKGNFQIVDGSGRTLKKINISLNTNSSFTIDVNDLPKGMYSLQLHTKTRNETRRFLKE